MENLEIMQHLINKYKVDPNKINKKGNLPIHMASCVDAVRAFKYLVEEKKSNPEQFNKKKYNCLHYSAYYKGNKVLKYLLDKNIYDFNALNG
jgi:ankyrin repeat protein